MQSSEFNLNNIRLLDYNQCLVYIENNKPFADVDGTTQIAKVLRTPMGTDDTGSLTQWYELELITDQEGDRIPPQPLTASEDTIVSNRSTRDIQPRIFYNFATLTNLSQASNIQYPLTATSFVIKSRVDRPLELTSRSALGSGIYGLYLQDPDMIPPLLTDSTQITYTIECPNAYIIQDKEHGDSLTLASLNTNRYLDRIIQVLNGNQDMNALTLIQMNSITNLTTLWNIVLYRTGEFITKDWLEQILANYATNYVNNNDLIDSVNGDAIHILPINDIMKALGHDGIIGDDSSTNGWGRGCVSYNYDQAVILQGGVARY
jgi:hypothetical protein